MREYHYHCCCYCRAAIQSCLTAEYLSLIPLDAICVYPEILRAGNLGVFAAVLAVSGTTDKVFVNRVFGCQRSNEDNFLPHYSIKGVFLIFHQKNF